MANLPADSDTAEAMPRSRVISYAMGDVANNVSFQMTSLFLMAYMTDIAGVPAAVAGTIYGVTKVWAGVTDLVAGNTVGRKETKWGRLRPWIVGVSPFLSISVVMLFSTPAGLSPIATVAWILLFDAAFQLCYSFVNIPYGSLSAAMTENATDRSRLAGARAIASSVTGVLLAFVLAPQFEDTAADNIRLKFTIATILLSVVALVLYWICFKGTKEVVPRSPGKLTLSTTLTMVRKNKPLLVLCLAALFLLGGSFTMNAVMMYYARDLLGSASNFTWLYLAQTIGTIGIASMVPAITVRFGKRIGYVALASVAVVGLVLIAVVPAGGGGLPLALIAFLVYGVGFGGTNALMFSMQADTVDYGEWRTGTRAEGGSYSILSFVRKCGQGVGGFVGGAVIGAFGYAAGAQAQSAEAIQGIKVAAGWIPAGLCMIAALILLLYPLGADQHRAIVAELHDRRAKLALGQAMHRRRHAESRTWARRHPPDRHRQRAVRRRRLASSSAGCAATGSAIRRKPLQFRGPGAGRSWRVGTHRSLLRRHLRFPALVLADPERRGRLDLGRRTDRHRTRPAKHRRGRRRSQGLRRRGRRPGCHGHPLQPAGGAARPLGSPGRDTHCASR